jgi:hypothetical protein
MTDEGSEWQRIGEIPIDTMRLVLVDPMSLTDVADHEVPEAMTYELVTNDHGVAVAMVLMTGLGDGLYPVEARFEDVAGGVRIAEVRIRFLPHPTFGYQLPKGESDE